MGEIKKQPEKDENTRSGTERRNDEFAIGNELSVGSASGTGVSDFNPENDVPRTEEKTFGSGGTHKDDPRSAQDGINPMPEEVDPKKKMLEKKNNVENADEDELNPYSDELKSDEDNERVNSTWMVSGQNRKI